jgi:hypothetical protein
LPFDTLERLLDDAARRFKPAFHVSGGCNGAVYEVPRAKWIEPVVASSTSRRRWPSYLVPNCGALW